jgi:S1-C subfamily serine protease
MGRTAVIVALGLSLVGAPALVGAQAPALVRSLSGPSGKVIGDDFVIDDVRSRFVYPQDNSLVVYFQWTVPAGDHVLSATWKQPDGRVAVVSPDVRIQTTSDDLRSYWTFAIGPGRSPGIWTVEVRIDGQPAGAHTFELVGQDLEPRFTLDRVFKTYAASLVWIQKLDEEGRRIDRGSGFVLAPGVVATAFQAIDAAVTLDVTFADGRRIRPSGILAASRTADWALLGADTGSVAPIPRADPRDAVAVGARVALFGSTGEVRTASAAEIGGVAAPAGYGRRMLLAPPADGEAQGGPVIDERGRLVGILGATLTPGGRPDQRVARLRPWTAAPTAGNWGAATLIGEVPTQWPAAGKTLVQLLADGTLTPPMHPMSEFLAGGVTTDALQDRSILRHEDEFSNHDDAPIRVFSDWQKLKTTKTSKGTVSVTLHDAENRLRGTASKAVSLRNDELRVAFSFAARQLPAGYYRIDTCWNGEPVWRTYVRIVE